MSYYVVNDTIVSIVDDTDSLVKFTYFSAAAELLTKFTATSYN